MTTKLLIFLLSFSPLIVYSQGKNDFLLNTGHKANPMYFLNGIHFNGDLTNINPDTVGAEFAEGDSFHVSNTYGNTADTSLIRRYLGDERDRGALFIFSKDKVNDISKKEFMRHLEDTPTVLLKIGLAPLTDDISKLNKKFLKKIENIKEIQNFYLRKWDSGKVDTFTLYILKYKDN